MLDDVSEKPETRTDGGERVRRTDAGGGREATDAPSGRRRGTVSRRHRTSEYVALAATALGLVLAGGPVGAVVAVAVTAVWYRLPAEYAFATGIVCLPAVTPLTGVALSPESGGGVLLTVTGLASLLAATLGRSDASLHPVAVGLLCICVGAVVWAATGRYPTWTVAVALLGSMALFSYGLHRYQTVALEGAPGDGS